MTPLLEFRGVSKTFGSTRALAQFSFAVKQGEIHALLGENGAGKSTALGLMYGVTAPDEGQVLIDGLPTVFADPAGARRAGIGCVFQELSLASGLSVAENVFGGNPPTRFGIVQSRRMRQRAAQIITSLGTHLDLDTPVGQLPVSMQQIVEIAKALNAGSRILLLDEPTSALAPSEIDGLRRLLAALRQQGIGMVYVSHHIPEVFAIADRITVLRDGHRISTSNRADTTPSQVIEEMVGGQLRTTARADRIPGTTKILTVEDLKLRQTDLPCSLNLKAGEITALAGLMGSGTREIALVIAGLLPAAAGQIRIDGKTIARGNAAAARAAGLWFVPEERKAQGLFLDFSVASNLTAASLRRFQRLGLVDDASMAKAATDAVGRFGIKTPSVTARVSQLSGGNQQKVMLSRWLDAAPRVLIVNEPSKGVDVGAKAQIHQLLLQCAAAGAAVLLVSSDFAEVLALADHVLLVKDSRIIGPMPLPATIAELVAAAANKTPQEEIA